MKLGKRLKKIAQMVNIGFDEIWDCCCDHGHLGFALLNEKKASKLHFVDLVPVLTDKVEQDLKLFYEGSCHDWEVHCIDVAQLPIHFNDKKKHLIIIAGIGGELMIELLAPLFKRIKAANNNRIDFILSPVHHNFLLRQFLIKYGYLMINEQLVFENNRGYEVLHISLQRGKEISEVGNIMWNFEDSNHQQYLKKTMQHYQRKGDQLAVKAYQALIMK